MKIHSTGNIVILLRVIFCINGENFTFKILLTMKEIS